MIRALDSTTAQGERDAQSLAMQLMALNATTREYDFTPLQLGYFDADNALRGGLLGVTGWDWLHIDVLVVEQSLRGQGIGSELVRAALVEAQSRGCVGAYLDTFDFQAKAFYCKLGFSQVGEIAEFPRGHRRHWLQLRFS